MRVSYSTELKQDSDGTWYRWLGTDSKGTKQKFRLGKNKSEASRRIKVIQQLHDMQADLARDQQILNAESNVSVHDREVALAGRLGSRSSVS